MFNFIVTHKCLCLSGLWKVLSRYKFHVFKYEKLNKETKCILSFIEVNTLKFIYLTPNPGRGLKSHAYTHSIQEDHRVFLNLETKKFYCLPDNYQVIDQSLEDIVVGGGEWWMVVCGGSETKSY